MARTVLVAAAAAALFVLLAPVAVVIALDVEAWQRCQARRRAIRVDVRAFEKGHR